MPSNFVEIIPTMKFPHPILSCKIVNSWTIDGRSPTHSTQEVSPRPSAYSEMTETRSGCVSFSLIHLVSSTTDCENASVRPAYGQRAMCAHVFSHDRQLGHVGSRPSWCVRNFIVPAIPRTCLAAQTLNNLGTECRVLWTNSQSSSSNSSRDNILFME